MDPQQGIHWQLLDQGNNLTAVLLKAPPNVNQLTKRWCEAGAFQVVLGNRLHRHFSLAKPGKSISWPWRGHRRSELSPCPWCWWSPSPRTWSLRTCRETAWSVGLPGSCCLQKQDICMCGSGTLLPLQCVHTQEHEKLKNLTIRVAVHPRSSVDSVPNETVTRELVSYDPGDHRTWDNIQKVALWLAGTDAQGR